MDVSAGHELRPMTGFSIMLTSCRGNHHIHIEDILKLPAAEISESTGFNSAGVVQFQRLCGRLDHWTNAAHVRAVQIGCPVPATCQSSPATLNSDCQHHAANVPAPIRSAQGVIRSSDSDPVQELTFWISVLVQTLFLQKQFV